MLTNTKTNNRTKIQNQPATEPEVATEPAKTTKLKAKHKISSLKLQEEFLNEIKSKDKI